MKDKGMFLIDTHVISECRKGLKANSGVSGFFESAAKTNAKLFISVITLGELRRGIELIRYRGDDVQALQLEQWIDTVVTEYADAILDFGKEEAQLWGYLRVPQYQNALDKQIAATALTHDLTVVTRNTRDFEQAGVRLLNPFE